ncbi:MAG: tRNA (adenosine(37)-N6)-threonylcarbamoyltransferase complex ATPase subunit type 1 TsaE [Dehalococcoidia bacterium]|nr:MAG: tRNA (adenosine(37)-N6)-threonylcarbamoyltransferase complex ATPase subunit type 1 TsaE [Dehalococcoidia bacterium]
MKKYIISDSPEATRRLGESLAGFLKPGDNIILNGNLGSGKTLFTKGIAKGIGIERPEYVNSPSFVIVKEYKGRINLYHFDLYRLEDLKDIEYIGVKEYLNGDGIVVIEWAERMKGLLPAQYMDIHIDITGERERRFFFKAHGKRYDHIISRYIKR